MGGEERRIGKGRRGKGRGGWVSFILLNSIAHTCYTHMRPHTQCCAHTQRFLLSSHEIDPVCSDESGSTLVHKASQCGHLAILRMLCSDLPMTYMQSADSNFDTPAMLAIQVLPFGVHSVMCVLCVCYVCVVCVLCVCVLCVCCVCVHVCVHGCVLYVCVHIPVCMYGDWNMLVQTADVIVY